MRLALFAVACTVLSCKLPVGGEHGDDPANGSGPTDNWSFSMSLAHDNFNVAQNSTDTNIVTFTRAGGFTGPINLQFINPDSGVVLTSEPVTTTGAITTTRLMTHVNGPHQPFATAIYGLNAMPVSDHVEPQFTNVHFSIVRKDGTFINAPATLSVGRGQSIQQRITIIRTNYTAPVPFTLVLFNGAPTGITATFSPNPATDTVTQMTLTADASVPEGTYSIGVRDNEGITGFQGTAPVTLTVTAPGSFTISLFTSTLAVPKNTTVPISVAINRTNFTGAITFSVSGVPAGVTTAFTNPATGNNFPISFTNGASSVPGSYPIVITATAPGIAPVTVNLTLSIS
jgi:hypothetical protein